MTTVRPNFDYAARPVNVKECIGAFGTARDALTKTGGEEKLALYYLHNRDRIATAGEVPRRDSPLAGTLAALARDDDYRDLVRVAASAYNQPGGGTVTAIMEACSSGRHMAQQLLASAQAAGMILTRPTTPKKGTKK